MPKILLVEDDNNLREIFEMRLQAEGYETATAGNGEEGLTVAMKEKPDLIISDVMMPKLSGFEMLETLRAAPEGKNIKVIMMTALGQAEDRARGERLGVVKYLVKSQATLEDFARVVREVLPPAGGTTAENKPSERSQNNQQERLDTMQEDPQTPTTPPTDPATPPTEPTAAPDANPVGAPTPDGGDQQSTAQEQGAVNDQINNFVASAPAGDAAPAADSAADTPAPADNPVAAPAADDAAATSTDAPATPPQTETPASGDAQTPADTSNSI